MNLEQIVKETVAKIVAEKELTAAEEKKREEIVKAMKKDFKGPAPAMYAIATDKAKKLAEEGDHEVSMAQRSLNSILRSAMELKAKIGNQEINIPAWIQDHITNSENFIDQASQGYHEYSNDGEHGEMDEANLGHNESSSIEQEGRFWIVTYQTANGTKEKSFESEDEARKFYNGLDESNSDKVEKYKKYTYTLDGEVVKPEITFLNNILKAMLGNKIYNIGAPENDKVELTPESGKKGTYEAFVPKSSFDDYKIGDNVTVAGKKAKITAMKMDDESGERRARVRFEDGTAKEISINTIDENTMTTNEGRSAEDLKQGQLDQAYSHLEKIKEKPKLFSSEDIKKAEARIEKLEAELDALAAKATNESLDEATVRRWQHYAGIK
jgi:hypothetical protein